MDFLGVKNYNVMNKKLILLVILFLIPLYSFADDVQESRNRLNVFFATMQGIGEQMNKAWSEKKLDTVLELNYKAISALDSNSNWLDSIWGQEHVIKAKGMYHYDIACVYSRQNKKEAALYHLSKAINHNYNDWKHIIADNDIDNIRSDSRIDSLITTIRERADYLYILKKSPQYSKNERPDTLPSFTYQSSNDYNLKRVKEYFKLDSVVGTGDEISKIKNVLTYIHNLIKHDGLHNNPDHLNAIDLAEACKNGNRGLNCRGLAIVLNECYLSIGIPSRYVTCMPKEYINDCHVINSVWSSQLKKWIWMDPTNNAWVTDEKGNLLEIKEVRDRLRQDLPVVLNESANWNNQEKQTTEGYLYNYMAKNMYYFYTPANQRFGLEDFSNIDDKRFIYLLPTGFIPKEVDGTMVNDDQWFWQGVSK